jgi:hypothetical protein
VIVNKASAAEGSGQLSSLFVIGEESVLESLSDYHGDILHLCQWAVYEILIVGEAPTMPNSSPSKLTLWMEYSLAVLDKQGFCKVGQMGANRVMTSKNGADFSSLCDAGACAGVT